MIPELRLRVVALALTLVLPGLLDARDPWRVVEFDTDEGTQMNVDVSPDGRTILFDLLGGLYTVPITGGTARLIVGSPSFNSKGRYSPDGTRIAFLSDRGGVMSLWEMNADGSSPRVSGANARSGDPSWNAGRPVLASSEAPTRQVPQGAYVGTGSGLIRIDAKSGDTVQERGGSINRAAVSPDGRFLVYAVDTIGGRLLLCTRALAAGHEASERCLDRPVADGSSEPLPMYAFVDGGRGVVLSVLGKLARVDLVTLTVEAIPFLVHVRQRVRVPQRVAHRVPQDSLRVKILQGSSVAPDGRTVAFTALGRVYVADMRSGHARRLTSDGGQEYSPKFSPDGSSIAYVAWTDTTQGQVVVRDLRDGRVHRLTTHPGIYASPAWSPDGRVVAFARLKPENAKQADGMLAVSVYGFDVLRVLRPGGDPAVVASGTVMAPFVFPYHIGPEISIANLGGTPRIFYTTLSQPYGHAGLNDSGATLLSVGLDGKDMRAHLHLDRAVDEAVASPDGRRVAISRLGVGAWVVDLPPGGKRPTDSLRTRPGDAAASPLPGRHASRLCPSSGGACYHVGWLGDSEVTYTFLDTIVVQALRGRGTGSSANAGRVASRVALTVPRARPNGTVAFTNARLVTMRGTEVIDTGTIVVDGNRIAAVGAASSTPVPAGATTIDVKGTTIIPGLIDVHAHPQVDGPLADPFQGQRWQQASALAFGVTTIFDPATMMLDGLGVMERVEAGQEIGPRIFGTGPLIEPSLVFLRGLDDARAVVRRYKSFGIEMLKEYVLPTRQERQWLAQAAREQGLMLTAEGTSGLAMNLQRIADGYTAFEHCLYTRLYDDVINLMAKSGVHYTLTLNVCTPAGETDDFIQDIRGGRHSFGDAVKRMESKDARFSPSPWTAYAEGADSGPSNWLIAAKGAAAIARRGGLVAIGSHDGDGWQAHWEIWGLQVGGMPNIEALRAGTLNGAHKIGYDQDLGSLEVGKLADFLVLDANPLERIENTAAIRFTVANGFVYDAATMDQIWPEKRPFPRLYWQAGADSLKTRW